MPPAAQPARPRWLAKWLDCKTSAGCSLLARPALHSKPWTATRWSFQPALEFPAGALRAESAGLRIEAVALLGDVTLVRRLASDFLIRFPASPLVERVRAVSGIVGEGDPKP
jgi:hypothetical protein